MSGPAVDEKTLFDIAVEENVVPDEYFRDWNQLAQWQMDVLRETGLQPSHRLLDVGCGALRLGSLAIPYLESGYYCGVDAYEPLLRTGRRLMTALGVDEPYSTHHSSEFEFEAFGARFDFAIAQSVFTHLSREQIERCVANLVPVMNPGGRFVFTYSILDPTARRGILYCGTTPMRVPSIDSETYFTELAARFGLGLTLDPAPRVPHRSQRVALLDF